MENLDILNLIHCFCEGDKEFVSLLSVTKKTNTLKDRFMYDKKDVDDTKVPSDLWYLHCLKRLVRYVSKIEDLYNPPFPIYHIVLKNNFDVQLMRVRLPGTLLSITFPDYFNRLIRTGWIPKTTKKVVFGKLFNSPLTRGDLPEDLEVLIFGESFNKPISELNIPRKIKEIIFGKNFNKALLPGVFPLTLKKLNLGENHNGYVPENVFPMGLEYLKLSKNCNTSFIRKQIPDTVTYLDIGERYNQCFNKRAFPKGLKELTIRSSGSWLLRSLRIKEVLPEGLETLTITNSCAFPVYLNSAFKGKVLFDIPEDYKVIQEEVHEEMVVYNLVTKNPEIK
jgi:hypothetical protein